MLERLDRTFARFTQEMEVVTAKELALPRALATFLFHEGMRMRRFGKNGALSWLPSRKMAWRWSLSPKTFRRNAESVLLHVAAHVAVACQKQQMPQVVEGLFNIFKDFTGQTAQLL